ncbi:hypothetical protein EB796_025143 [Bugula neritina]|uniref:Uncharacterized protein n=1 Tax=Bugula neritina TaxID=10212 RepID=A0A7J7IRN2_BUGNE|nr:hypothetical protein EB796_025143 [Bugula neritina]
MKYTNYFPRKSLDRRHTTIPVVTCKGPSYKVVIKIDVHTIILKDSSLPTQHGGQRGNYPTEGTKIEVEARITSLSKQLSTNSNSSDLELFKQLYRQLNESYSEFNDIHASYCELVEADDKYKEYRVVSSLDLNAYYDVVKQSYDEAVTAFNGVKLQSVEYDIEFACMSAKQMLHKSSNCDNLNEHIILCKELSKKYFDIARKFHVDLENVISEMQTSSQAQVNISHLPVSRNSSSTVLSGTDNGHAAQDRLGRGGVRDVVGVSFGGALQPEQTLADDNLNKYPHMQGTTLHPLTFH